MMISESSDLPRKQSRPAMWSETVGLRTRPVSKHKKSVLVSVLVLHAEVLVLVLVLQVWRCVAKHRTLVFVMILKDTATFQLLFIVSILYAWNITTTVEINSGVYLLKKLNPPTAFVYFRWSWSWSQSCYIGFGLTGSVGLKNLHHWSGPDLAVFTRFGRIGSQKISRPIFCTAADL